MMPNYPVPGEAVGLRRLFGQIWYKLSGEVILWLMKMFRIYQ